MATLPCAWRYRVSAGTGRSGVSILWLGETESLICSFYLSGAARTVWANPPLRYTRMLACQAINKYKEILNIVTTTKMMLQMILLFAGCLTSQQHASVSQGRVCSNNFTYCLPEIEVADPTPYLTQSQYTDTGPTSPSTDLITPGAWQGSHWSANFEVTGIPRPGTSLPHVGFKPGISRSRGGRFKH